jgi:carnitine O-acetyltransferase
MQALNGGSVHVRLHNDGKAHLDHLYSGPDPRTYFQTLRKLDYRIPQLAKPRFAQLIAALRERRRAVTVLDIGCSYGINAALLRCDLTMDDLYAHYGDAGRLSHDQLLERDRSLGDGRPGDPRFVGLDISATALKYGQAAGFLDDAVLADLEAADPTPDQRARLARTDLAISTGCIGYVTELTIARVVRASDRLPWMAHFVLRMYPFDPVAACLADLGYTTTRAEQVFRQRRFASPDEQVQVQDTLSGLGLDPSGLESDGWLYAQLFISRPRIS